MERITIASDHGGYELKQIVIDKLKDLNLEVNDLGTSSSSESVDYPDFAHEVANKIANGETRRAILICGTGIGMSITANRYTNVRAGLCNDVFSAKMSREHNNANVLVLGARVIGSGLACEIVDIWMNTAFEGGRHSRRVDKIENINGKTD